MTTDKNRRERGFIDSARTTRWSYLGNYSLDSSIVTITQCLSTIFQFKLNQISRKEGGTKKQLKHKK